MELEIYNPDDLSKPLGLYSHIARAEATAYIYIAGQVAVDSNGNVIGENDFGTQMRQVFKNLQVALKSAGADFSNVVKFTTYMTNRKDIATFMRVRDELFSEYFPNGSPPPNTLLMVAGLVKEAFLLEVEAVAAL